MDAPLADDNSLALADAIQADYCLEDETINKIYTEHSKSELWGILACFTAERESLIIKEIFVNNRTMAAAAREQGISLDRVRKIKEKGLRKLRTGGAICKTLEKFDVVEAGAYRNSMDKFSEHGFTSMVEHIALRRAEIQAEYEERIKQIDAIFRQRESVGECSKIDKNVFS